MKKKILIFLSFFLLLCFIVKVDADTNVKVGETTKIFSNSACVITDCTSLSSALEVSFNENYCQGKGISKEEAVTVEVACKDQGNQTLKVNVLGENESVSNTKDIYANIEDAQQVQCSALGDLRKDIQGIFNIVKIVVPGLIIVMSTYDFIRAIAGKVEGETKKAFQKFLKRLAFAIILFFLPNLLDFLLGLIDPSYTTCINS